MYILLLGDAVYDHFGQRGNRRQRRFQLVRYVRRKLLALFFGKAFGRYVQEKQNRAAALAAVQYGVQKHIVYIARARKAMVRLFALKAQLNFFKELYV